MAILDSQTGRSRSAEAMSAVTAEVARRAALLDAGDDIVSVTVTLKFTAGVTAVRGTVWQEERLAAKSLAPAPLRRI